MKLELIEEIDLETSESVFYTRKDGVPLDSTITTKFDLAVHYFNLAKQRPQRKIIIHKTYESEQVKD